MSAALASAILQKLLDRIERRSDRVQRVMERLPDHFSSAGAREACYAVLRDAERAGAIETARPRNPELRHLIERVVLLDAGRLYGFLGRIPVADRLQAEEEAIRSRLPALHSGAEACLQRLLQGWRDMKQPLGISAAAQDAVPFLRALDAVLRRAPDDRRDLRSFSAQELQDSKLIECQLGRILAWLTEMGSLPSGLSQDEAAAAAGLAKFPHPVLIAGDVQIITDEGRSPRSGRSASLGGLTYFGVAPPDIERLEGSIGLSVILTIENFASFNRYVREAIKPGEAAIYTGGFPSPSVVALLRHLRSISQAELWHWGDIDPGGIRIAEHLAQKVDPRLRLHLMTPALAKSYGRPSPATPALSCISGSLDVTSLAQFLAGDDAHHLEQEVVDPQPVPSVHFAAGDPEFRNCASFADRGGASDSPLEV